MRFIDPIQRAVDWIEENLRADIRTEDAAREAGFSLFHFSRLFAGQTGLTVMQFVTKRRLRHAAHAISQGKRIIDAAYEYGFDSVSGFTRAFHREFGCTPREYAHSAHPLPPEKVILKEMKHIMFSPKLVARALASWNITEDASPLIHSSGARSENTFVAGKYLLHVRENRAPLALSAAVERQLAEAGLPSVRTLPTACGEEILELDGLFFRLTGRPSGSFIPARDMYEDLSRPRAVGQALAHLHEAIRLLEQCPELSHANLLESTLTWSLPETARAMNLPASFVNTVSEALTRLIPLLPTSPIHRNPTPDAFLFTNGVLSGYSQFEMTEINIRLFDLCYAATAILSETLNRLSDEIIEKWPFVLSALIEGYDSVSPLTEAEKEAIPYIVLAVQMVCVAFFSSQQQFHQLAEINIQMTTLIIHWLLPDLIQ